MGITVGLYFLDWVTGYFFAIHYCPTLKMTRLGETAVELVFEHPRDSLWVLVFLTIYNQSLQV